MVRISFTKLTHYEFAYELLQQYPFDLYQLDPGI